MSAGDCRDPLSAATLVDYWAGELPGPAEAATEEHLMGCGPCSARAGRLTALARATRELVARGAVPLLLTPGLRARLERDGVRIRNHVVEAGGQTRCTAGPDDDLIAITLRAELRAGERVDLAFIEGTADLLGRREDVPVDHERGEVVFAEPGEAIRALPTLRARVALYGVGPAGQRTIGEYTLLHTPWAEVHPR